jgi:hypothetical protein
MKYLLTFTCFCIIFAIVHCSAGAKPALKDAGRAVSNDNDFDSTRLKAELPEQIAALKRYNEAAGYKYSARTAILIDMRIPSRFNRLFIVDLRRDSIVRTMLVAHGSGSETAVRDSLQFSNTPNSYMTSLGVYKIGASYQGSFGRSFKLHGLEKTNSKAFERLVVLHRYTCVPDGEQPQNICNSLGCPMVSENNFPVLEKFIDAEKKPVLLKIYY